MTRVERGLQAMLALRRERLAAGERPLGWKVAFGAPASLAALGLDAPVVGFLTDRSLLEPPVSIAGWTRAVVEPEVAVRVGPHATVAALAPAFELADLDLPLEDVEAILARNIFHRGIVLGEFDPARVSLAGVEARVLRDGREHARTREPEALTGAIGPLVRHVAGLLASAGEELRENDVVICGSIVPPIAVESGERIELVLGPIGRVELRL